MVFYLIQIILRKTQQQNTEIGKFCLPCTRQGVNLNIYIKEKMEIFFNKFLPYDYCHNIYLLIQSIFASILCFFFFFSNTYEYICSIAFSSINIFFVCVCVCVCFCYTCQLQFVAAVNIIDTNKSLVFKNAVMHSIQYNNIESVSSARRTLAINMIMEVSYTYLKRNRKDKIIRNILFFSFFFE